MNKAVRTSLTKLARLGATPGCAAIWLLAGPVLLTPAVACQKPWKVPHRYAKRENPIPLDKASLQRGRRIYVKECLSCHGRKGKGDGKAASTLDVHPRNLSDKARMGAQTDGELFYKIRKGRRPMPTYRNDLTDEDIWSVVHYIRTFSGTGKAGKKRIRWFRGKPPELSPAERIALTRKSTDMLAGYDGLRQAYVGGKPEVILAASGRLEQALIALTALTTPARMHKELATLVGLARPLLKQSTATKLDPAAFSDLSGRLAELLRRYKITVAVTWRLYRLDLDGGKSRLRWLQSLDQPVAPPILGMDLKRVIVEEVFPVIPPPGSSKPGK